MIGIIVGILLVFLILFEWNLWSYRPLESRPLSFYPKISVLIPCRNESRHIEKNVISLLEQDYPEFEVIVFDDESDDGTPEILEKIAARYSNFRYIQGEVLPEGWTGKNRACHELSVNAKGEWLLFVDADTTHAPGMLKAAVGSAIHRGADFLSTFPRQRFASFGDALVVPLMFFVLLSYLPMYFVAKRTWKWAGNFSAACGQYLLVKKEVYEAVGGHASIRSRISEAPLLASAVKARGSRIVLMDGSQWVSCSMYRGFGEAFRGFSRSVFASMGGSVGALLFFLILQTFIFHVPYVTLAWTLLPGHFSTNTFVFSLIAIAIPLWVRYRIHLRTGMLKRFIPLHALSILAYHVIMINSFIHYRFKRNTSWKNRAYANPQC